MMIRKCELCDYTTKNAFFLKRHKARCRRDHGIVRGGRQKLVKDVPLDSADGNTTLDSTLDSTLEEPTEQIDGTVAGSSVALEGTDGSSMMEVESSKMEVESHSDPAISESSSIVESGSHNGAEITAPRSKAEPAKKRLYQCTKCDFLSKNSRKFLYHQVETHKVSMNIYTCEYCEYSSRFRHKVLRHMKAGHSVDISTMQNLQPEYVSNQAPWPVKPKTAGQVKPKPAGGSKRVLMSKHGAGKRKLMVKFGRPQTGAAVAAVASAEPEVEEGSVSPPVSMPVKDRLSRVVEEVVLGNGEVTFKCKECTFVSEDRQQVAKHAVSWHVDTKSFTCSHCDYITFERTDFISHRLTHRNEHQFKCDECTYSTDFRPNYDRHMSNHKGSFPYKCNLCTFGCGSETVIRRHMANNHTPIPPQATVVPPPAKKLKLPVPKPAGSVDMTTAAVPAAATSTPVKDISAVKTTYSPSKSPQKTPEKPPPQFADLLDPLDQSSANYLFQISKASFLESDSVSMVPRPTIPPPSLDYTGLLGRELSPQRKLPPNITQYLEKDNGKLVCPVCKLKYKRSSDLNRHMKRKHNVKLREYLENCAESGLLPGVNASTLAELSFGDDDENFDEHDDTDDVNDDNNESGMMESENSPLDLSLKTDSDDSPIPAEKLKCKYCNYQAKWSSDLKRHYSVHSIEKRYKCNYCPKKYKYIGDLNVHVRKDHNKEPGEVKVVKVATMAKKRTSPSIFKCPSCDYTSAWKSEVDRHSRLHTGEKTFQCSKCDYQTHWRGDIRRHVYKRHPDIMGEGVAIDDVIIKKKARSPVLLPGGVEGASQLDQDRIEDSMDLSFQSDGERLSREVTPVKMNVSRSHEPSPEVNMSDYVTKSVSGHSPTPSPIKDLGAGMYKCQYCGFIANAPSKMNSHIATHTNLKRYMCPVCGRRANWKWDIAKHIRRDHNDQVTQVIKLGKQEAEETIQTYMDSNPVVRRDHHLNITPERTLGPESTDQYFKCSLCDFSAEKRISVARHMRYMHSNVGQQGNILMVKKSSPDKRLEVSQDQVTAMALEVQQLNAGHVSPEKMFPQQAAQSSPIQDQKKSVYVSAPSSTSSPSKYSHLVENFGPQDAAKPFMCSECGKRGATKGDVKKHYHYAHADKEIRIIYLGDGSQSVYSAKSDIGPGTPEKPPAPEPEVAAVPAQPPQAVDNSGSKPICKTPKAVGYIKPYVCGHCGRRSNWRWDMSKHIRERHPGQESRIIELTEEEARSTIQDYLNNQLPRLNRASSSVPKRRPKDSVSTTAKEDQELVQQSVADIVQARDEYKKMEQTEKDDNLPEGGSYNFAGAPVVGQFKQYKCSGCAYRSNYRSDIQRHIPRRHGQQAKVILLDKETARATLDSYTYKRCYDNTNSNTKKSSSGGHAARTTPSGKPSGPLPKEAWAGLEKKIWKCSMCAYSNEDKVDVLKHVGKHNLKAYKCTSCNWTSNFRSAVQRHIQSKHPSDDLAQCRLSIKLIKEGPGVDQSGRSIMPDGVTPAENNINQSENPNSAESLPSQVTAITGLQSMNNPQSFMSTALFYCKVCNFNSTWRSCVCRHLLKVHRRKDYVAQIVKKIVRTSIVPQTTSMQSATSPSASPVKMPMAMPSAPAASPRKKNFHCNVCPYKTYKGKMLKFHMTCHKPQPGVKQVKCKYCPYFVSSNRLLSQHLNLHLKDFKANPEITFYPTTPVKAPLQITSKSPQAPKRHRCEKCPYTTNSKNDFLYHKQFHRPKPTADYKCDFCDYWVSHRRLIKQHMKVHEEEGYYSDSIATPSKSEYSENSLVYDTVEIAAIKQRIISSKITPSISQNPLVSPMKIAASCSVGGRRSFLRKDGTYRKIHQCRHCPYMNIRLRNMKLHELMHGKRSATHPLMKCPHCDYFVGSKGLLAHHMKVHQPNYGVDYIGQEKEKDRRDSHASEDSEMDSSIGVEKKVDTLLEITRFKKYGCEKCPYASSKRSRFQRHVEMHGSKQKCKCDFCDYSVPTMNLLNQHMRLHFEPNQNLLAAQSILNLQYLPEMPADVALASMMTNNDSKNPVSITHDHIDLYENQPEDLEPKKLYRCDRCPYANIRRDHLLAHLRCHMVKNEYACPYCDYSVGKTHVLVQHVKVHFSPLPEFSEWLAENGDKERIKEVKNKDMKEAMEVVKMFQNEKKGDSKVNGDLGNGEKAGTSQESNGIDGKGSVAETIEVVGEETEDVNSEQIEKTKLNDKKADKDSKVSELSEEKSQTVKTEMNGKSSMTGENMGTDTKTVANGTDETTDIKEKIETAEDISYVCQYCDRDFPTSDCLVRHEMQHLIGNNYEDLVHQLMKAAEVHRAENQPASDQSTKIENQPNGQLEQTGTIEDEVKPGPSGIIKQGKGVNRGKNKDNSEEVPMETD